jgi:hypothetical protein
MFFRRRLAGDRGSSMIDLIVGMSLMTFFMVMFTGAVVMMNKTHNKAQSMSQTAAQLNQAFLWLDRTVRYADAISDPGKVSSGDWYVEFRSPRITYPSNGDPAIADEVCTQVRVNIAKQQLQKRSWTAGTSPPSAFLPIASGITNGTETATSLKPPFDPLWKDPDPSKRNPTFQQIRFNLVSVDGSTSTKTESRSAVTFTAVNSTIPPPTGSICGEPGVRS